jgi:hypothetical protein
MTRSRRLTAVVALVVVAGLALWWVRTADVRRVDAACSTWLEHRESLRTVLMETVEAVERAEAERASMTGPHFNDVEREIASLERWESLSPGVREGIDDSDPSALEQGAAGAFEHTETAVVELHRLIEHGTPQDVDSWLPEVQAVFQGVDDTCLVAARQVGL